MAPKRMREYEETETVKRLRPEEETDATMADRLTDLPESLKVRILSSLETRHAFQTSILSKSWVSAWTFIPYLNFNSYCFKKLYSFDKFVASTLSLRGSVKLDKLTFRRGGTCSAKILKRVFDYAFSQGVRELEAYIMRSRNSTNWPISFHTSSDSLTNLKLESDSTIGCSFLGPRSGSFQNLTILHLKRVMITDLDPFSGFPALDSLILVCCRLQTTGNTLNIHALQLTQLTISYYNHYVSCCELMTPKLRYFKCRGINFPRLKTHPGGYPVLGAVVIDYYGFCSQNQEKIMFEDLLMLFNSFYNAKSLVLSSSVVHLLSLFLDELVNRRSPFWDLKCLMLDFSSFHCEKLFEGPSMSLTESLKHVPDVKAYLLQNSHDANCTVIHPKDPDSVSPCSNSQQINTVELLGVPPWQS